MLRRFARTGETVQDCFRRVASTVGGGSVDDTLRFTDLIIRRGFTPNGRTLKSADQTVRPACCVLPPHTLLVSAAMERGVGVGVHLSGGEIDRQVATLGSIPAKFEVSGRRPGLMVTMDWKDPQALHFSLLKTARKGFRGSSSMEDPRSNANFSLVVPPPEYHAFRASNVFEAAVGAMHESGCPGILFPQGNERCTAPCGELFLHEGDVCTLGTLNAARYILAGGTIATTLLQEDVADSLDFLDRVVELYDFPLPMMRTTTHSLRRVGLGVTNVATALQNAGIAFRDAGDVLDRFGAQLRKFADATSSTLAEERGSPIHAPEGHRFVTKLAVPPTGGISLLRGYSPGIEPLFHEAHSLSAADHVTITASLARHIDASVSKTVNLKSSASLGDVREVIDQAFAQGLRGITIFRNSSQHAPISCTSGTC